MHTITSLVAVVEDDAAMRTSIERLLQASGYASTAYESAEEFLQSAILDSVDGLVLDIQLAGISGIALRRRLSAMRSTVPVVFITAHDDEATYMDALDAGCVAYLQKPFEPDRLIRALKLAMRA